MSISAWCTNWIHGTSLCFEEIAITFPVLHPNPRDLGVKIKVIYKKTSTRLHHQTVIVPTNCEIHGYASYVWDCLSIAIHRLVISLILVVDIKLHFKTNIKNSTERTTNKIRQFSVFICLFGRRVNKKSIARKQPTVFFPETTTNSPILQERKKDLHVRYWISHQGLFPQQNINWISLFHLLRLVL